MENTFPPLGRIDCGTEIYRTQHLRCQIQSFLSGKIVPVLQII